MNDDWTNGATVDITVEVNGCGASETCYLSGWINWSDDDTDFADTSEQVFDDQSVTDGSNALTITVPASGTYTVGDDIFARFRVCGSINTCDNNTNGNEVDGGEVEDYYWEFGPTSVTVSSLEAHSPWLTSPYTLGAAVLLLVVTMGGVVLVQRRKA